MKHFKALISSKSRQFKFRKFIIGGPIKGKPIFALFWKMSQTKCAGVIWGIEFDKEVRN